MTETINNFDVLLSTIKERADDIQSKCRDYVIPNVRTGVKMTDYGSLIFDGPFGKEDMPLSAWAIKQLGVKTGIPGGYLTKCVENGFGSLAANNVNTWFEKMDKRNFLLRTYDGKIRGIATKNYALCDAPDIIDSIKQFVPESEWTIKGSCLNEERMHLRFVGKDPLNITGDKLYPTLFVDTSDVGRCGIKIRFGIYRLACTNGLMVPEVSINYMKRHIGNPYQIVAEMQKRLVYLPQVAEHAEDLVKKARSSKIKLLSNEDLKQFIKEVKNKSRDEEGIQLVENDIKNAIKLALDRYDDTRWGIVNGFTEYAQTKNLEDRLRIERAAGIILNAA